MKECPRDATVNEKQKKLEFLNALSYPIILKVKNHTFCLKIIELSLMAVHENLEIAYRELCQKKEKLFNDSIEFETVDTLVLPHGSLQRKEMYDQLKIFVAKVLIVCLLGGVFSFFAVSKIKDALPNTATVKDAAKALVDEVEKIANEPQERRQERTKQYRAIISGLRPIIQELQAELAGSASESNLSK